MPARSISVAALSLFVFGAPALAEMPTAVGEGEGQVDIVAWPGYIERGDTDKNYDWVTEFEKATARYIGSRHAIGCASGSDALLLSLMALGVKAGDEVITVPFTFFATAGAISRLGAKPVFVDIEADSFNIDPHLIERAITPRSKAVISLLVAKC